MKAILLPLVLIVITSCASVEGVNKSLNCTVWRDQKYWGPFSIEVVENKITWNAKCKGYNSGCKELNLSLDENKNMLKDDVIVGKIENNELKLVDNHALSGMINYTSMKAFPETKEVKAGDEVFKYNDKCSTDSALLGGVSLGVIKSIQAKGQ